ncbi:WGR domain-containing protein [Paracoccus benzoatiresistens]|uniref:WGR domain-containing protein n=1 Tax=Paracoccus benzoatiresistens TaxID=2997341 RepID=A0ABT4J1I4_9RHOB|nr:WGR domain-containing protein [Paracoccus sp. EF6]MCZ0960979.1 WGR domain-containing protein [Paracoccus sp. EF6]
MISEPDSVLLDRRDPDRNMARFYRLDIMPDLFGGVVLVRNWGRVGHRGQERQHWFADLSEALQQQATWIRRKQRRGYSLISYPAVP